MLMRICAGGIVFHKEKVLLLLNDKHEWVFPKGLIRGEERAENVALQRVLLEAGLQAAIVREIGSTTYQFFSSARQRMVQNDVSWYLMTTDAEEAEASEEEGFSEGDFFTVPQALQRLSHSPQKAILLKAYQALQQHTGGVQESPI